MRITKRQLKRIIKEEKAKLIKEQAAHPLEGSAAHVGSIAAGLEKGTMSTEDAAQRLKRVAGQLYDFIGQQKGL